MPSDAISASPKSERLLAINKDTRVLPFGDNTFDFVVSDEVLEHVQDHAWAFAEIERVMKPGGINLRYFPPNSALLRAISSFHLPE